MEDRAKLSSQLVRCHALLWSVEDPSVKSKIRERIRDLESRIAALDQPGRMPAHAAARLAASRLAR